MKKKQSASAELSIELSKISAAATVMSHIVEELSSIGDKKKQALDRLCKEIKEAHERAVDHLQTIALHASMI
jgi:hypothetical protein